MNSSRGHFRFVTLKIPHALVRGTVTCGESRDTGADAPRPRELGDILKRYGKIYWIEVTGESMVGAGLRPGDLVAVSITLEPQIGHLVAARVGDDDQPIVKRYTRRGLISEYADRKVRERFDRETQILGVVVWHFADQITRRPIL